MGTIGDSFLVMIDIGQPFCLIFPRNYPGNLSMSRKPRLFAVVRKDGKPKTLDFLIT